MRIYLAFMAALLAVCGMVSADNEASVSATALETIELDMGDINTWALAIGDNTKNANFNARANVNFDVYAREDSGDGKMVNGAMPMNNALVIHTDRTVTLSGSDQQIAGVIYLGDWSGIGYFMEYKQQLTYDDPAGSYSMTITYTGQAHV